MGRSLLSDFILPVEEKYADQIDLRFYRRRADGIRHSRAKHRSGISLPLFTQSQVCQPDGGVGLALPVHWQGAVAGQRSERVWLHAAISALVKVVSALSRLGFRGPRRCSANINQARIRLAANLRSLIDFGTDCERIKHVYTAIRLA